MQAGQIVNDPCQQPVFVLTAGRSGSTLLRFILDSHPELACPPETNVALACGQLASMWKTLESALPDHPGKAPSRALPGHIRDPIKEAIDSAYGHYLKGVGKQRWCDKSPDSCWHAGLLAQLYPEAKFICLYRHCMDVVASAIEAYPWGLPRRIGFEYITQHPGNSVATVSHYWLAQVQQIMNFEEENPRRCYRLRYEDLVGEPEQTAESIFSFLGIPPVPGITQSCFRTPHSKGPGDKKIWRTNKISTGSVGRGVRVPASRIPPHLRADINEALVKLDYRPLGERRTEAEAGADPRADESLARAEPAADVQPR